MGFSICVRRIVGYFGFRDKVDHWLFFISTIFSLYKQANGVGAPRYQKQYGSHSGSGGSTLAMSVIIPDGRLDFSIPMMVFVWRDILMYSAL